MFIILGLAPSHRLGTDVSHIFTRPEVTKLDTPENVKKKTIRRRLAAPGTGMNRPVPPYARLFFDHLYSEYLTIESSIKDPKVRTLLQEIYERRQRRELTWANIYTFDLTLVDERPTETLIRKAYDARAKYRSVAGQKEYDEYLASKPPDLTDIQLKPDNTPPDPIELLRADIKYLLGKFYLYYAMLPVREGLRDDLTKRAAIVTGIVVVAILAAIILNVGVSIILGETHSMDDKSSLAQYPVVFVTVLTVTLAGIIGGCVSMLQRIQSAPSEGDALFNLAALTNGWRGILLSPMYGGIFASLLFVLFAAGILNGSIFPVINTPKVVLIAAPLPNPKPAASAPSFPSSTPTSNPSGSATPSTEAPDKNAAGAGSAPKAGAPPSSSGSTSTSAAPPERSNVLQIKDFLKETGPADGISYAMLIIWSFLAGFAERLVPDTLNRLIAKNQAIQGNNG